MPEDKLVSIVLPTYNGSKYIRQSIDSCLNQTYKNLELIVVDDCSSDNTGDIVKSYSDARVIYIRNEKNLKLPSSLNVGFKKSKGSYLTWTSDDNYYAPNAIEEMLSALEPNSKTGLVYANYYLINEAGEAVRQMKVARPAVLQRYNCIGACFLYRRAAYEKVGDYDPDFFLAEDYEYWLRIKKQFKIQKINKFLYYYRLHKNSLSSTFKKIKIEEQVIKAVNKHIFLRSTKYYHNGLLSFYNKNYAPAQKNFLISLALNPFNSDAWKLLFFAFLESLSPDLIKKIKIKANQLLFSGNFYKKNKGKIWDGKKTCFSLSFDCDYEKDIDSLPDLLDALSRHHIKASFACVGKLIEEFPGQHSRILKDGHEIVNHTYSHPNNFNELTGEQQKEEIKKCDEICKNVLNCRPSAFRTPHFGVLHTENVYDILKELGYKCSSSTTASAANCGLPFFKKGIMEIPLSACPKHALEVFDTWHCLKRGNARHARPGEFFKMFKALLGKGIKTNSYINVYFDPQDAADSEDFKLMLDYLDKNKKNICIATYKDIYENSGLNANF